jgi:glycosyltransferase involved in cell wall biosynthesis
MTYQRAINRRSIQIGSRISYGSLWFSAISDWMMRDVKDIGTWRLVYNGVQLRKFDFTSHPGVGAPLVFLGRMEEIKGPHLAIEVARRAGANLILAGNVSPEHELWFRENVLPHVDGERVSYVGPVNDAQKNSLLGSARGLLMPILWDEPFGIVMAEAMACGTPVLGFARGAVAEVVEHGRTGYVCENINSLVESIQHVDALSRTDCRLRVERLFSEDVVIDGYISIYREMINRRRSTIG